MSRPRDKGLRDMALPTIADLRACVDAATRYCEDCEALADEALHSARWSTRVLAVQVAVATIQVAAIAASAVILVTR